MKNDQKIIAAQDNIYRILAVLNEERLKLLSESFEDSGGIPEDCGAAMLWTKSEKEHVKYEEQILNFLNHVVLVMIEVQDTDRNYLVEND